jgi:hypothetical protein
MSTRGRPTLYKAENGFFAHLQPTTSVSATKVFPGGLRPPAIAKSLAEIAGIAEMGAAVHPMGETAKLRTGGSSHCLCLVWGRSEDRTWAARRSDDT